MKHAALFANDFQAVRDFASASASVSDIAPSLPKGIQRKITKGIQKGLVETESLNGCFTSLSSVGQNLTIDAIVKIVTAETAAVFHKRVPQYLFNVLHDSYKELYLKLVAQLNATSAHGGGMAGMAFGNEILSHTPPDSSLEDIESDLAAHYESDTLDLAHSHWDYSVALLDSRGRKLERKLQEVDCERKALSRRLEDKAAKIKGDMQDLVRERRAVNKAHDETIEAMKLRRVEQDRTGDYGTKFVGYHVTGPMDFCLDTRQERARRVFLKIEKQAAVNRLFNMPWRILMQKAGDVVLQRNKPGPDRDSAYSSIKFFLGVELAYDGNIVLWAESTDDYDRQNSEGDMFDGLQDVPLWDHDLFTGVARHVTEPYKPFEVEMKHITADMISITYRKEKAAVMTELVKQNITFIPSLHIDVVKDIHFSRRTTYDNSQALVLEFSNPSIANEVIEQGLRWQESYHPCEVFDNQFFDRCGRCQTYGHHAHACIGPLRCARCAESHLTKLCRSAFKICALCHEHHRYGSSRCRARTARESEKFYARFLTGNDSPPLAVCPVEEKDLNPSRVLPAVNDPAPQDQYMHAKKKAPPNFAPAQIHTEVSDKPTLSSRQLHNENPKIEDALGSNKSAKRGLTSTTERFEPAPEPRIEERTNLTSKELEKIGGTSKDPARELRPEKWSSLTIEELEKRRRISEEPAQKPRVKRKRERAGKESEKRRRIHEDPAQEP